MPYDMRPITITPGVASTQDFTPQSTNHWTFTQGVRFVDDFPQKVGGWVKLPISGIYGILGKPRNIFSYTLGNVSYYIVGTNSNVYMIVGNTLFNATPVDTTTDTYTDVLGTIYNTLATDPFMVVSGSKTVVVTDTGHPFLEGDSVLFSGSSDVEGIPAAQINTAQVISYIDADHYSFVVATAATGTNMGGGAAVVRTCRLVTVQQTNTYVMGQNVVISALASSVGGIATSDIEGIRVVRNVTGSSYNIVADAFATSSASAVGGSVTIAHEIAAGQADSTVGSGYGMGLYGVGLYGTDLPATSPTLPRIWSFDRFGLLVIMTPGNQTGLYQWNSTTSTLPELVTNAPTAINYAFSSDNIAVTLGAGGTPQRVQWSDLGNLTVWTATPQNQAGLQDVEGAAQFLSHAAMQGFNLLFTNTQVYTFRYIGPPFVWQIQLLDVGHGLIAQNARVVVDGVAYWMGNHNWYWYNGGNVDILPSNTTTQSTIRKYIFNNLNQSAISKIFAWYNPEFNEIWWHVPTGTSTECNTIARFNILTRTWCMDSMDRTAGEYPSIQGSFPYLADRSGNIFQHENGNDDDTLPLEFSCYGPFFNTNTKRTINLGGVYPDNILNTGQITIAINATRYPPQPPQQFVYDINSGSGGAFSGGFSTAFQVGTRTNNLTYRINCRYWQYAIGGNTLGQFWRAGQWQELYMLSTGWR